MYQLLHMQYTDEREKTEHFRLMDRIQSKWERFATALKFPRYTIQTIQKKTDPVFELLAEWLRGANRINDARPLTWRTFITALWKAGFHDEADILEKYFVTEPAQETSPKSGQSVL